jgi:hypothetical protein
VSAIRQGVIVKYAYPANVGVGVGVGVRVGVGVGVRVGVRVGVGVEINGVDVCVGVRVGVGVEVGGVDVCVGVGVEPVGVKVGVDVRVRVGVIVGVKVGVAVARPAVIVRMPIPATHWPSGLHTDTFFEPVVAAVVLRLKVTEVAFVNVALLTVTPPVTVAVRWFRNPGPPVSVPGSKNPDPATDVPVIVTDVAASPCATDVGSAEAGVAGGGAMSCTALAPYVFVPLQNSWIVHIVMSSFGSTLVKE